MIEVIGFEIGRGTSGTLWHDAMTLTRTASWNVNHCRVRYAADEPFTVSQDGLVVTGVTGTPGVRAFSGFVWDAANKIATWTFAQEVTRDVLSFALSGPDPNGWVVSVLQGDVNGDRQVVFAGGGSGDSGEVYAAIGESTPDGSPFVFMDTNGDGTFVEFNDMLFVLNADGETLDAYPHPAIAAIATA